MKTPTSVPRYAELSAKVLARDPADAFAPDALTPAPIAIPDRAATVREIQRALQVRVRRRTIFWSGVSVTAAAAALLLFVAARDFHWPASGDAEVSAPRAAPSSLTIAALEGSRASIETSQGETAALPHAQLEPGALVRAPRDGHLVLALDTGTRLRFAAAARTRVIELGDMQRFDLESGALEAAVAKLKPGHRFVIATPDAEIEVKGTRFELSVEADVSRCEPFVRTRLVVREGLVVVRHGGDEVRVAAGSAWPTCPLAASEAKVTVEPGGHAPHRRRRAGTPTAGDRSQAAVVDPSTLPEQNDLFAAAIAARRRGNRAEAIRWLDRLVARYPTGQLAESAHAERQRLLDATEVLAPAP